jgi:hypothetical protein
MDRVWVRGMYAPSPWGTTAAGTTDVGATVVAVVVGTGAGFEEDDDEDEGNCSFQKPEPEELAGSA